MFLASEHIFVGSSSIGDKKFDDYFDWECVVEEDGFGVGVVADVTKKDNWKKLWREFKTRKDLGVKFPDLVRWS